METGCKPDRSQVEVETSAGLERRNPETPCAPLSLEQTPEASAAPEPAPQAATRAHSGPHGAAEGETAPVSPVVELRAAAAKLRKLIAAIGQDIATNPYWASNEHPPHVYPSLYARGVDNGLGGPAGAFAAAMHPGVGTVLVKLLDLEADVIEARQIEDGTDEFAVDLSGDHALAIARLINGEAGEAR